MCKLLRLSLQNGQKCPLWPETDCPERSSLKRFAANRVPRLPCADFPHIENAKSPQCQASIAKEGVFDRVKKSVEDSGGIWNGKTAFLRKHLGKLRLGHEPAAFAYCVKFVANYASASYLSNNFGGGGRICRQK